MNQFNFGGHVIELAEREFAAHASLELQDALYKEWVEEGSPKDVKAWIGARLKKLFPAVGKRPVWVRKDAPDWLYHKGKPMLFLGQIDLPEFKLPTGQTGASQSIYVFGAAESDPDDPRLWTLEVKTTIQMDL